MSLYWLFAVCRYKFTSNRVVYSKWDWGPCCFGALSCPTGRTLDYFDTDIVVDVGAHQDLCQMCCHEGNMVVYRLAGADMSDSRTEFVMSDVPDPFRYAV
jgi:hypothetical protein